MNNKRIAHKLKELRGKRTLSDVAKGTGLRVSTISNYESGLRIPKDDAKKALAKYYQKTVDEIFFA